MQHNSAILEGYQDMEKGAYLGAIASIATADRVASDEEFAYIDALIDSANVSEAQANLIREAAKTVVPDSDLEKFLDVLKSSELRFALISDVIAFAHADQSYSEEEKQVVEKIASYLGVNHEQYEVLDQFTKKAVQEVPKHAEEIANDEQEPASFMDKLGFGDKLQRAGINSNALFKGALGILGPVLLSRMFSRGRSGAGGGLLGGLMGSVLGGGRSQQGAGGGLLGSLMGGGGLLGGLLGGGKGFKNAGGLLGRILGKR